MMYQKKKIYSLRKIGKNLVICLVALAFLGSSQVLANSKGISDYQQVNTGTSNYNAKQGEHVYFLSLQLNVKTSKLKEFSYFKDRDTLTTNVKITWWIDSKSNEYLKIGDEEKQILSKDKLDKEKLVGQSIENIGDVPSIQYLGVKEEMTPPVLESTGDMSEKGVVEKMNNDLDNKVNLEIIQGVVNIDKEKLPNNINDNINPIDKSDNLDEGKNTGSEDIKNEGTVSPEKPPVPDISEPDIPQLDELTVLRKALSTKFSHFNHLNLSIIDSEVIDQSILIERGKVAGVDMRIISWMKDGTYKLQKGVPQKADNNFFPTWDVVGVKAEAKRQNTPILFTGGFWSFENLDSTWSQKELSDGKTGFIYSSGKNDIQTGYYKKTAVSNVMETMGSTGFNVGAFGAIIQNGQLDPKFGVDEDLKVEWGNLPVWQGDIDRKSSRTLLLDTKDNVLKVIVTNGHSSNDTGLNHGEIRELLSNVERDNINTAFMLDGGGSTRAYSESSSGSEEVFGSFVDDRAVSNYLYLTKEEPVQEYDVEVNLAKANDNESESINVEQYFEAKEQGLSTVPGTQYDISGNYDHSNESSETVE